MTRDNDGSFYFGFWDGMPYKSRTDSFEDFTSYKNSISKAKVIQHIESLDPGLACAFSTDIFTGETFNAGVYWDGAFTFPVDFLRYYKTQDIGIPYEYEEYLKTVL